MLICQCPHRDSHTASGQRPHQRMRVDPTVCRQLFRCGLPQSSSYSTPITPCPAPPGCNTQVPCRSVARSVHHGVTDKQGFCFLFALQLMFLACSTLPLNVLCLLYCLLACLPPQISVIRESTHLLNKPGKERESFKSSFPSQPRTNYIEDNTKAVTFVQNQKVSKYSK